MGLSQKACIILLCVSPFDLQSVFSLIIYYGRKTARMVLVSVYKFAFMIFFISGSFLHLPANGNHVHPIFCPYGYCGFFHHYCSIFQMRASNYHKPVLRPTPHKMRHIKSRKYCLYQRKYLLSTLFLPRLEMLSELGRYTVVL